MNILHKIYNRQDTDALYILNKMHSFEGGFLYALTAKNGPPARSAGGL